MSGEEVESLAQGRVWMGLKAFDNRLVDQCNGGYLESFNQMAYYKLEIRIIVIMDYS